MTYQVSTVEYTTPEGKNTATVIKVVGTINLDNITLPRTEGCVYVENNRNEWIFMYNHAEDNYAGCVDNTLEIYYYNYGSNKTYTSEAEDDCVAEGAHNQLTDLCYIKAELRGDTYYNDPIGPGYRRTK